MDETLFPLPEEQIKEKPERIAKVRIIKGKRNQIGMIMASLDELLPQSHRARVVWKMVEMMDLSQFYKRINAVEGEAGRPAIDPRILIGLWLNAILDGIGSARELARRCQDDIAYRWLGGDLSINYHTLADFRVGYEEELDDLLVKGVAALMKIGLVKLEQTAQDGLRVRASAGTRSFRKREKLEQRYEEAKKMVEDLKGETQEASIRHTRQEAAQERAAREQEARLKKALEELGKMKKKQETNHKSKEDRKDPLSSSTDPEARFMQMPAGEMRPAYNGELCIDTESRIIVGVDLVNEVDAGQMVPMLEQIKIAYKIYPKNHLVDGGFSTWADLEAAYQKEVKVFAPLPKPRRNGQDPSQPRENDTPGVRAWRERMTTDEAIGKYKIRASTIEWANALARYRGFKQMVVRGIHRVRAVLLWVALAHNLMQTQNLLVS